MISMERNTKLSQNKYFPGIHKFEKHPPDFDVVSEGVTVILSEKKTTLVKSIHIQDGYESFSLAVSDKKDPFYGLYIFYTRSQGVTALVSVSDDKIQIAILILIRGPCLIFYTACFPKI